ncbi:MAG: trypsin [Candidatus Rokuibacteriota bacterium]|nr:MAG: trypsin [Candidatus Rokubacteria bacterium]PYN51853.1 MAG: trypsin [Candidatus Rokubacteria bacterium]PYN77909.1 MAG: trypsin [Candidatus Rokubacteria bacterium]
MTVRLVPALIATLLLTLTAHAQTAPPPGIPAVVAKARPAVVNIATRQVSYDAFLKPVPAQGIGSGVIFDARGYVLTNAHVVEGAQQMRVTLPDGRTFPGKLVGADPVTDLAVVKIEGSNFPVATLGDSGKLEVGETVIAIGHPLGLEGGPTVTVGVVSAVGRSIEDPGGAALHDLIQTDAAINPGNSGGPLVRMSGAVIGINTAIIEEAQGIGFAISIDSAKPIVQELLAHGRVVRPLVGIVPVSVTPQLATAYELPVERGVLVARLDPKGPAAKAGMKPGDIIVAIAGQAVKNLSELRVAIARHKIGETVDVAVRRQKASMTLKVTLAEMR